MPRDLEDLSVYHYLSFLTTPAPLTMFRGIYKLPAGHHVTSTRAVARGRALLGRAPGSERGGRRACARLPREEALPRAVTRVRELLDEAVEKRLMSDVPFGVFLSGGVDSTAITGLMARHVSRPVRTFTVGFSDHEHLNELSRTRATRRRPSARTTTRCSSTRRRCATTCPSLVFSQDEPIADWVCIPLYFVSKLLRDSGTTVVLVGEGADEQFCGYQSYMAYLEMYRSVLAALRAPPAARAAGGGGRR